MSTFLLSEIQIVDDRTVHISFTEKLAQEPVDIFIIDSATGKEIGIKEIKVIEPERLSADVTTLESLKAAADYTFLVGSARSMSGNILAQKDVKEGSGITLPDSIPLSIATKTENEKSVAIDEFFKKAKEENSLNSAPPPSPTEDSSLSAQGEKVSNNSSNTVTPSQETQNQNPVLGTKKLPKTGAETWYIVIVALLASFLIAMKARKKTS